MFGTHSEKSKNDFDQCLVIGNGESRRGLDIEHWRSHTIIGCNAIHRDILVDYLVCCDRRMVEESLANTSTNDTFIYTRPRHYQDFRKIKKHKNVKLLPELPFQEIGKENDPTHWGSGPFAVLLACELGFKNIHIVGFDLYGIEHKVNNIYKGTPNYAKTDSHSVDPAYWIHQLKKTFCHFHDRNFFLYNLENWKLPKEWTLPNVIFCHTNILTLNTQPV